MIGSAEFDGAGDAAAAVKAGVDTAGGVYAVWSEETDAAAPAATKDGLGLAADTAAGLDAAATADLDGLGVGGTYPPSMFGFGLGACVAVDVVRAL